MARYYGVVVMSIALLLGCGQEGKPQSQTATDAKSDQSLVITPGQGLGELRFGMNRAEMERILGKPDNSMGMAHEYLSTGMAVIGSRDTAVVGLMFGDMNNPESPLVAACKYKTDKGIGMDSTLDALVNAYGHPSSVVPMGKRGTASYKALGATFVLMDGKIIHMQFRSP